MAQHFSGESSSGDGKGPPPEFRTRSGGIWDNLIAGLIAAPIIAAAALVGSALSNSVQKFAVCGVEADQVIVAGESALNDEDLERALRNADEALVIEASCKSAHWLRARTLQQFAYQADRRGELPLGMDLKAKCFGEITKARPSVGTASAQFRAVEMYCRL